MGARFSKRSREGQTALRAESQARFFKETGNSQEDIKAQQRM